MAKGKVELKLVAVSLEMHERIRHAAFECRVSMKEIVERALKKAYGWSNGNNNDKGGDNDSPTKQSPSP